MLDRELIGAIHGSGRRWVGCLAGGGVTGLAELLATPGASRSVLEAVVPYASSAMTAWLGGVPDQATSEPTARAMAMAAWRRAMLLDPASNPVSLAGVSCTASLATDRPKRGEHRIYVGVQTAAQTIAYHLPLEKNARSRDEEEALASGLFLAGVGEACQCDTSRQWKAIEGMLRDGETIAATEQVAPPEWNRVLLEGQVCIDRPAGETTGAAVPEAIFAGAFSPPHAGHLRMAELSEALLDGKVAWEVSMVNVDKPPLDWISVAARVAGLRAVDARREIILSPDATFVLKARRWPGATFVVGSDTLARIADPRYYGDDPTQRDLAVEEIARHGCRFLVFGRLVAGVFRELADLDLPATLRGLCEGVEEEAFRVDVSSTALRRETAGG